MNHYVKMDFCTQLNNNLSLSPPLVIWWVGVMPSSVKYT